VLVEWFHGHPEEGSVHSAARHERGLVGEGEDVVVDFGGEEEGRPGFRLLFLELLSSELEILGLESCVLGKKGSYVDRVRVEGEIRGG